MFKKRKKNNKSIYNSIKNITNFLNGTEEQKREIEDFILILKQIQEINNQKTTGKGSVLKNYTYKKNGIKNATGLAIEKYIKKIEELDNANI